MAAVESHCTPQSDRRSASGPAGTTARARDSWRTIHLLCRTWHRYTYGRVAPYISGHGPSDPDITGLEYSRVKKALLDSPARMKVVVLDCCYSGRAIEALADPAVVVADSTDTHGVYTLTASDNAAHVVPFAQQSKVCTSFTGEFIDLIRSGIPDAPRMLTLGLIYFHLRRRLRSRGLPVPNQRGTDTSDRFPFVRNVAAVRNRDGRSTKRKRSDRPVPTP